MKIEYYDLYYTVIKNRYEKEIADEQYEGDYINYVNFIIPYSDIGIKPSGTILR